MKTKRKKIIIVLDICIVVIILLACVLGKNAFDKYKMETQQAGIAEKQLEIQNLQVAFEQETDRTKKLDLLKSTQESYEAYQKEKESNDECVKQYESVLAAERAYFEEDYNNVITANSIADVGGETDQEKINACMTALTELKNTIQTEYDTYSVITEDQFTDYTTKIDSLITAYTERIGALNEAELKKQQEEQEEQKKKEQEKKEQEESNNQSTTAQKKNSSTSSSSSRSNSSSNSSSRSNTSSTNSNTNSSSSSNSSSNSTTNNGSSSNTGNSDSDTNTSGGLDSGNGLGNEEDDYWYIDPDTGELYR